jgi:hypothetical protein
MNTLHIVQINTNPHQWVLYHGLHIMGTNFIYKRSLKIVQNIIYAVFPLPQMNLNLTKKAHYGNKNGPGMWHGG